VTFVNPETWPSGAYFGIGAVVGASVGLSVASLFEVHGMTVVAIAAGAIVLGGLVGVATREHLVEILSRWF
jgi:hypothetical protein